MEKQEMEHAFFESHELAVDHVFRSAARLAEDLAKVVIDDISQEEYVMRRSQVCENFVMSQIASCIAGAKDAIADTLGENGSTLDTLVRWVHDAFLDFALEWRRYFYTASDCTSEDVAKGANLVPLFTLAEIKRLITVYEKAESERMFGGGQ